MLLLKFSGIQSITQEDGIRVPAYSLRLPKNKWADHQMLPPESCFSYLQFNPSSFAVDRFQTRS